MAHTRIFIVIACLAALLLFLTLPGKEIDKIPEASPGQASSSSPLSSDGKQQATKTPAPEQKYLGSEVCADCHAEQYQDWQGSHHDLAMQEATPETVLGNFDNVRFKDNKIESLFFKKDNKFYIRSQGASGETEDFKVTHTFGAHPLQQYLVSFPNGRKQVFPVAWDTQKNEWYFVQAELKPEMGEWIHWTQGGMNWNGMCADCHSTNLDKNYQVKKDHYETSFSEADVACEACHGPGGRHLAKVTAPDYVKKQGDSDIDMHAAESPHALVDKCGRCHSRRQPLGEIFKHNSDDLLDHYLPAVLRSELYQADGQILEEVFVYGSYLQSRHYQYGVACTSCHDPHSTKLRAQGNKVCTACHASENYDSSQHHHHPAQASNVQCVDCHMPGQYYMVRDFRRDHSFRVPRPDLSAQYGTANACNQCHDEKDASWASEAIDKWYGEKRRAHFSDLLARTSLSRGIDVDALLSLITDRQQPAIVRASALHHLAPLMQDARVFNTMILNLSDSAALVRTYAAQGLASLPAEDRLRYLAPLLDDPVRAVRLAAASGLLDITVDSLEQSQHGDFISARAEYQDSVNHNADLPAGRHQLAVDYHRQRLLPQAERHYLETLRMDDHFNSARLNLAQLYYQQGQLDKVEALYRKVIEQEPHVEQAYYSLGLLMAEKGKLDEAAEFLEKAAEIADNPRAWYNLAVLNHQRKSHDEAEKFYLKALSTSPLEPDFLLGIYSLYAQLEMWGKLEALIDESLLLAPNNQHLLELKMSMKQQQKTQHLR